MALTLSDIDKRHLLNQFDAYVQEKIIECDSGIDIPKALLYERQHCLKFTSELIQEFVDGEE